MKLLTENKYERMTHKDVPTDIVSEESASPSDSETCGLSSPSAEPTLEFKYPTMLNRTCHADESLFNFKPPKNILRSVQIVKAI